MEARVNLARENNTQALMEALYEASGRSERRHPQHATYTGLAEEFHRRIGQALTAALLPRPGLDIAMLACSDLSVIEADA